jgi:hypothetical protein
MTIKAGSVPKTGSGHYLLNLKNISSEIIR